MFDIVTLDMHNDQFIGFCRCCVLDIWGIPDRITVGFCHGLRNKSFGSFFNYHRPIKWHLSIHRSIRCLKTAIIPVA